MKPSKKMVGKVIKTGGLNVWPHEQLMADILAAAGHVVEFLPPATTDGTQTPDVLIDGLKWEMKSPRASNLKTVERNLKRARWQSSRIVFASHRMKQVPDRAIERELHQRVKSVKGITSLKFINRHGNIIDIL
ncbi:hypothetical protein FWH13_01350 [Candidatus Saccharibacteria bacterium]|nr:hypothetical protein [Candidatus Saccharibacteria bacterium]